MKHNSLDSRHTPTSPFFLPSGEAEPDYAPESAAPIQPGQAYENWMVISWAHFIDNSGISFCRPAAHPTVAGTGDQYQNIGRNWGGQILGTGQFLSVLWVRPIDRVGGRLATGKKSPQNSYFIIIHRLMGDSPGLEIVPQIRQIDLATLNYSPDL
ncbi:MAG: hypothetical protein PHR28_13565, partial [candidate division Zixibacteria bacterium]|nr:hypothetical protein [candidate division Zixibacteria bacterium]